MEGFSDPTLEQAASVLEARYPSYTALRIDEIRFALMELMEQECRDELTAELAELTMDNPPSMEQQLIDAGFGSAGVF